jgi:hypothetical protein
MEIPSIPYIPPDSGYASLPLERYLPPCRIGIFPQVLKDKVPKDSWLIDPLGTNPFTAIQAAKAGYRILVARSNPLIRFVLEMIACAPKENDFRSALNDLMRTQISGNTLAIHLQQLYQTRCSSCNELVQVRGYIWEKGHDQPRRRIYDCLQCGQKGDFPLSEFDLEILARVEVQNNKTRARAKQRIAVGLEGGAFGLDEALGVYPDRSLYFLMTLINKIEGLSLQPDQKKLLQALFLSIMDIGNNLWHWPEKPYRPLTLSTPAEFIEQNLWLALQEAIRLWTILDEAVSITRWPELPPQTGGICLYQRNKTDLQELITQARPQALLANFPRPNQAFLTFTVLWSGWLWGAQAVQQLHSALENRRHDWRWLAGSLQLSLKPMDGLLPANAPAFGIVSEPTPSNLFGILTAARQSSFHLKGLAFRQAEHLFQLEWTHQSENTEMDGFIEIDLYRAAVEDFIKQKGEPVNYEELIYACRISHALSVTLPQNLLELEEDLLDQQLILIKNVLQDVSLFITFKNQNVPQGNQWWPVIPVNLSIPLSDRVENTIFDLLQKKKTVSLTEVDQEICLKFRGLCTPSLDLIRVCLESYADPETDKNEFFTLRSQDEILNRAEEISKTINTLQFLAVKFGYRTEDENPLTWHNKEGRVMQKFFIIGNGIFSPLLDQAEKELISKSIIIFPASRSRLILHKLRNNAFWQSQIDQGWRFLKMRHVRKIAQHEDITPTLWEDLLNTDPLLWDPPVQLQIL